MGTLTRILPIRKCVCVYISDSCSNLGVECHLLTGLGALLAHSGAGLYLSVPLELLASLGASATSLGTDTAYMILERRLEQREILCKLADLRAIHERLYTIALQQASSFM